MPRPTMTKVFQRLADIFKKSFRNTQQLLIKYTGLLKIDSFEKQRAFADLLPT